MDGIILKQLIEEASGELTGKMVQSVSFYGKSLVFSTEGGDLAFHLGGQDPWIQVAPSAGYKEKNSSYPFFSFIKKNMGKGRIKELALKGEDRVVSLTLLSLQALGMTEITLVAEMITGKVNAFIVSESEVQQMWKPDRTSRALEPGDVYLLPREASDGQAPEARYPGSFLVPSHLRDEMARQGVSPEEEGAFVARLLDKPRFYIIRRGGRLLLTLLPYTGSEVLEEFERITEAVNAFYGHYLQAETLDRARKEVTKYIKKEIKKTLHTLDKVEEEEREHGEYEAYRKRGELLLIYASRIKGYHKKVTLTDPASEEDVEILIDPALTPSENAQKYFKRYTRGKRAVERVKKRKEALLQKESYLRESLFYAREAEDKQSLAELGEELDIPAYRKPKKQQQKKRPPAGHRRIEIAGGAILYGKSGRANEQLSLKTASPDDLWLHVRNIPGAHVIVKKDGEGEVSDELLHAAAQIAVWFSQSRGGGKVPVDVTLARHVRKPKGTPAGFVLYDHFKTLIIDQDADLVRKLLEASPDRD